MSTLFNARSDKTLFIRDASTVKNSNNYEN